jgi:hypothetical protein
MGWVKCDNKFGAVSAKGNGKVLAFRVELKVEFSIRTEFGSA